MDKMWLLNSMRLTIPPVPGGNEETLKLFRKSGEAKKLTEWFKKFDLHMEPERAKLFEISESGIFPLPAARDLSNGLIIENKISLLGESAYMAFLNDSYSQEHFSPKQLQTLSLLANQKLSQDLATLIQEGGGGHVVTAACCCCCCCCSQCCCSCASYGGGHSASKVATRIGMLAFGDHSVNPKDTTKIHTYYRGAMGVVKDGKVCSVLLKVKNDPKLTILEMTIAMVNEDGNIGTFTVNPEKLKTLGPTSLANQLWG